MTAPSAVGPGVARPADPSGSSTSLVDRGLRSYASSRPRSARDRSCRRSQRRRQDDPARGDRAARLGPLPPDLDRRRARPLGRATSPGSRAAPAARRSRSRSSGPARRGRAPGSGSGSTGSPAGRPASSGCSGPSSSPPRRCSSSSARRVSAARRSTSSRRSARRPTPTTSRPTPGRSSSGTASSGRSARSRRRATELRFWDDVVPRQRRRRSSPRGCGCSTTWPGRSRGPTPRSPRRRPARHGWRSRYVTNAPALPGESPRDALARRLVETAEKEVWNGSTLIGPHRDDLVFELDGRDLAGFASRGQQRTAILAFKLAELDLLTDQDGRPPLLLLDDVFSELDPERRSHLVRRIAGAAPGVRHDDDARRPRSRRWSPPRRAWEVVAGRGRRRGLGSAGRVSADRIPTRDRPAPADDPDRRPAARRGARPRPRGRAPPVAGDGDLRAARRRAGAGGGRRLPRDPDRRRSRSSSRPTRRSSPRSSASASRSCSPRSPRARPAPASASSGSSSAGPERPSGLTREITVEG